jgi:archaellum component FlaC
VHARDLVKAREELERIEHEIKQLVLKKRSAKSELEAQNHKADAEKKVRMLHMLKKQIRRYDSIEEQCMHDLRKAREELERIVFTRQYE